LITHTRQALDRWKKICNDLRSEALMFPSEKAGVPFTSRNWLERNLQPVSISEFGYRPVGKHFGIRTPLTFQVLRRSFATHNQKRLKSVQADLGHESTGTPADVSVVEVSEEVRRTQERTQRRLTLCNSGEGRMPSIQHCARGPKSWTQLDARLQEVCL